MSGTTFRGLTGGGGRPCLMGLQWWGSRMRKLLLAALLAATPVWAQQPQQLAYPLNQVSIPEQASNDTVSNFQFFASGSSTSPAKAIYSLTVKTGASAGYALIFDAAALPGNGAVTSCNAVNTARP